MDSFLYRYIKMNYPTLIVEDNIEDVIEINNYDILVKFKNGNKILFDTFRNQYRYIQYNSDELTDEEWKYEFGIRLNSLINRRRITQEELAERLGTSQTMITRYINGYVIPSARVIDKLAKILNCSTEDFFYRHY